MTHVTRGGIRLGGGLFSFKMIGAKLAEKSLGGRYRVCRCNKVLRLHIFASIFIMDVCCTAVTAAMDRRDILWTEGWSSPPHFASHFLLPLLISCAVTMPSHHHRRRVDEELNFQEVTQGPYLKTLQSPLSEECSTCCRGPLGSNLGQWTPVRANMVPEFLSQTLWKLRICFWNCEIWSNKSLWCIISTWSLFSGFIL